MITFDSHNCRVHSEEARAAVDRSFSRLGAGRSIVVDRDGVIIGGNDSFRAAQALGMPVRVIDSDGSSLIAVRRIDLAHDDPRRTALAIEDNRTNDLSFFDDEKLAELIADVEKGGDEYFHGVDVSKAPAGPENANPDAIKPEVEFSEELLECHNYLVLYFDNDVDWLQAQTLFQLKTVKDSRLFGKSERRGIGRVLRGADALNKILGAAK